MLANLPDRPDPDLSLPEDGLNQEEQLVLDCLIDAWNGFVGLPELHPDHTADFRRAIHEAQRILAMRIVIREYPSTWGNKEDAGK
jgi:hypothetical protein